MDFEKALAACSHTARWPGMASAKRALVSKDLSSGSAWPNPRKVLARMTLSEFVARTCRAPWRYGVNDCAMWPASAVHAVLGEDPAADLRGTYDSRFGCHKLLIRSGGLLNLVAPRMDALGLADLQEDGVALLRFEGQSVGAVVLEHRAIVRTATGLRLCDNPEIVRGWSCRRR